MHTFLLKESLEDEETHNSVHYDSFTDSVWDEKLDEKDCSMSYLKALVCCGCDTLETKD